MKLITSRDRIRSVSKRWDETYLNWDRTTKEQFNIGNKLRKLDLNKVTSKEVADIIGNNSWSYLDCNGCGEWVEEVVMFMEQNEEEYECNSCSLCINCLKRAILELTKLQSAGVGK